MTGAPLALDSNGDLRIDAPDQPAALLVPPSEVPAGATLLRAELHWSGTQEQPAADCDDPAQADDLVTLEGPSFGPLVVAAGECRCTGGGAGSHDIWSCHADLTSRVPADGASLLGDWFISDYVGKGTGGDKWWLILEVLGIDEFAPRLGAASEETWSLVDDADADGQPTPGDRIGWTIALTNTGSETGTIELVDDIPPEIGAWALVEGARGARCLGRGQLRLTDLVVPAGESRFVLLEGDLLGLPDLATVVNSACWSRPPEGGDAGCVESETLARRDRDADAVHDTDDNCPETPNPGQEDLNGDGVGDA